jgi:hypothetical protein
MRIHFMATLALVARSVLWGGDVHLDHFLAEHQKLLYRARADHRRDAGLQPRGRRDRRDVGPKRSMESLVAR